MRNKRLLFFLLLSVVFIGFSVNSCKKDKKSYIETLFTGGHWQLASLQVSHYVGDTTKKVDTLNVDCNLTQDFTFNADKTCTYTNYNCIEQSVSGHWSLSVNQLYLSSDISLKDTTANGSHRAFENAQIINLGEYSLVLQTGDLESFYPPNKIRTITRYGFVRQKTP